MTSPDLPTGFNGRVRGKEYGREWEKKGWSNNGRNRGNDGGGEGTGRYSPDVKWSSPTFERVISQSSVCVGDERRSVKATMR